jgi:hypothetical protein
VAAAFCVSLFLAERAGATPHSVTLGEVTARGVQAAKQQLFSGIVRDEFARLDVPASASGDVFELSATLVHFRTEARDGTLTTTCIVSAIVRDRRGGALRAILRGQARGEDSPDRATIAERSVMKVAVASALKRVREAVR